MAAAGTSSLERFHPAYFAMSMATGITAVACHLHGLAWPASILFWLNLAVYATLWALTLARLVRFPGSFRADWSDHNRSVGFFTSVAATCVLGTTFALLRGNLAAGRLLWFCGIGLWLACMYGIFTALTIKEHKPSLAQGINGGWLVAVVASQSVCVLGCAVAESFGPRRQALFLVLLGFWLAGGMLYIWLISLIFYRYTFFAFLPSDLSPPYWINMGALAISTLAGAMLASNSPDSALIERLLPFIKGFSLWYWATATWWIPMLLILGVWRHVVNRFPLRYDPLYWGAVFPLAMYAVATHRLAAVLAVDAIRPLSAAFVAVALAAWTLAFIGWARRVLRAGH